MTIQIQFDLAALTNPRVCRVRRTKSRNRPIAWVLSAWARWRERRLLEELDDRMLRDMGISRSQARFEANKPFWVR